TLFSLLDHPHIALTIDVGHAHVSGNLEELMHRFAHRWAYTHLADNHGSADDHLGPGMGGIDWHHFASIVAARETNGPFIYEFPERFIGEGQEALLSAFAQTAVRWPQISVS